jgi:hypothetical protein
LRCSERSSADGGSPKMKNLMKKKIRRAMESWPRRKPWVKERLHRVSGVWRWRWKLYDDVAPCGEGTGEGVATWFAIADLRTKYVLSIDHVVGVGVTWSLRFEMSKLPHGRSRGLARYR